MISDEEHAEPNSEGDWDDAVETGGIPAKVDTIKILSVQRNPNVFSTLAFKLI